MKKIAEKFFLEKRHGSTSDLLFARGLAELIKDVSQQSGFENNKIKIKNKNSAYIITSEVEIEDMDFKNLEFKPLYTLTNFNGHDKNSLKKIGEEHIADVLSGEECSSKTFYNTTRKKRIYGLYNGGHKSKFNSCFQKLVKRMDDYSAFVEIMLKFFTKPLGKFEDLKEEIKKKSDNSKLGAKQAGVQILNIGTSKGVNVKNISTANEKICSSKHNGKKDFYIWELYLQIVGFVKITNLFKTFDGDSRRMFYLDIKEITLDTWDELVEKLSEINPYYDIEDKKDLEMILELSLKYIDYFQKDEINFFTEDKEMLKGFKVYSYYCSQKHFRVFSPNGAYNINLPQWILNLKGSKALLEQIKKIVKQLKVEVENSNKILNKIIKFIKDGDFKNLCQAYSLTFQTAFSKKYIKDNNQHLLYLLKANKKINEGVDSLLSEDKNKKYSDIWNNKGLTKVAKIVKQNTVYPIIFDNNIYDADWTLLNELDRSKVSKEKFVAKISELIFKHSEDRVKKKNKGYSTKSCGQKSLITNEEFSEFMKLIDNFDTKLIAPILLAKANVFQKQEEKIESETKEQVS